MQVSKIVPPTPDVHLRRANLPNANGT
jgi:hypothetical protein